MNKCYIVEMDDSKIPAFPDCCVLCGQPRGEEPVVMTIGDENSIVDFWFYKLPIKPSQGPSLNIPVHDACAKNLRNRLLIHFALTIIIALSTMAVGVYIIHSTLIGIALAVLVGTPLFYALVAKVPPVELNKFSGKYLLVFRDRDYAESFARFNKAKVREGNYPIA